MATLKSNQFAAQEGKYAGDTVAPQGRDGRALHYEVSFPATVAAGDNMILGYLDNNYPLPELGYITSDGGATALTVDIGHGEYDESTGTLTVTDRDSISDGTVVTNAGTFSLVAAAQPAGVFTRVTPSVGRTVKRVLILTAVAETGGENANLIIDLPVSPNPTS